MTLRYQRATEQDLELLVSARLEVLRAANGPEASADLTEVERESRHYYRKSLADRSHAAVLVFDGEKLAGTGGVSYYRVLPTFHNPTGERAYIMNMYTHPSYRRKGIARQTLILLLREVKQRGLKTVSLETTDMGRPFYEKYGFRTMDNEMELTLL